jgi:F0F1-type ATP synthase membrane subunit a
LKGVAIFIGIILVSVVFCGILPFQVMPGQGVAMALPVVTVPGEKLADDFLGTGFTLTNTFVGTVLADVIVLAFAFGATRKLRDVPGRLQGLFEVLTDALYGVSKSTAGAHAKKVFPLMATIFLFLLTANWLELVPGVDSIGLMHCAEEGFSGYPANGQILQVDKAMDRGTRATEENYKRCHAAEAGHGEHDVTLELTQNAVLEAAAQVLGLDALSMSDIGNTTTIADYVIEQNEEPVIAEEGAAAEEEESGQEVEGAEAALAMTDAEALDAVVATAIPILQTNLEHAVEEGEIPAEEFEGLVDHLDEPINDALYEPYYRDDIHVVTSFVRAATTDLNLTLGLGLFAFIAIQVFGVRVLGIGYFAKFINTPALENAGKNPGGLMDFGVGFLELISEISKIISFGFRLFGNIFAGQVLLFVIPFLVSLLLPITIFGLELFVGMIQAFIFAMLTLVFSAMAMQGHEHGDEEHH